MALCYLLVRIESGHTIRLLLAGQPLDRDLKTTPKKLLYSGEEESPGGLERVLGFLRSHHSLQVVTPEIVIAPGVEHDTSFTRTLIEQSRKLEKELTRRSNNKNMFLDACRRLRYELLAPGRPKSLPRRKPGVPIIVWCGDRSGHCTWANNAWRVYSGCPGRDLDAAWESAIHPEDRAFVVSAYREACAARGCYAAEYRLRAADGQYHWVRSEAEPRFHEVTGEFLGYIGTTTEIVRRKGVQLELRGPRIVEARTA